MVIDAIRGGDIGWLAAGDIQDPRQRVPCPSLYCARALLYTIDIAMHPCYLWVSSLRVSASCPRSTVFSFLFFFSFFFLISFLCLRCSVVGCSSDIFLSSRPRTGLATAYMYVWSSHIAEYARGQLNRENSIPLSPCVPENLVSRDGFSRPVPRQPAHLHPQAESGAYSRDSSRVPRRRPFMKPPYAIGSVPSLGKI